MINHTKIEVFCGTGGVGKTSLASSRALFLASQNYKTLLITIDPSLRLKDLLNLTEEDKGSIKSVKLFDLKLDTLLMSPSHTFDKLRNHHQKKPLNRILKILTRPYGGLIEILSLVELSQAYNSQKFDYIVLDTAPGGHFLDFLKGSDKIIQFFDKKFIEVFNFLNSKEKIQKKQSIFKKLVSSGIGKLIGYLEKVTNKEFIYEFLEALKQVYSLKDSFLETSQLVPLFQNPGVTKWFLVTSTEQLKVVDALDIKRNSEQFQSDNQFAIINKSTKAIIDKEYEQIKDDLTKKIIDSILQKELKLKDGLTEYFSELIFFPEINSDQPTEQLKTLYPLWCHYEI